MEGKSGGKCRAEHSAVKKANYGKLNVIFFDNSQISMLEKQVHKLRWSVASVILQNCDLIS